MCVKLRRDSGMIWTRALNSIFKSINCDDDVCQFNHAIATIETEPLKLLAHHLRGNPSWKRLQAGVIQAMPDLTFDERLDKIFSTVTMTESPLSMLAEFQKILDTQLDDMPKTEQRWVLKCYQQKLPEDIRWIVDTLPTDVSLKKLAELAERAYNRRNAEKARNENKLPPPYTAERERVKRQLERQDDDRVLLLERKHKQLEEEMRKLTTQENTANIIATIAAHEERKVSDERPTRTPRRQQQNNYRSNQQRTWPQEQGIQNNRQFPRQRNNQPTNIENPTERQATYNKQYGNQQRFNQRQTAFEQRVANDVECCFYHRKFSRRARVCETNKCGFFSKYGYGKFQEDINDPEPRENQQQTRQGNFLEQQTQVPQQTG